MYKVHTILFLKTAKIKSFILEERDKYSADQQTTA